MFFMFLQVGNNCLWWPHHVVCVSQCSILGVDTPVPACIAAQLFESVRTGLQRKKVKKQHNFTTSVSAMFKREVRTTQQVCTHSQLATSAVYMEHTQPHAVEYTKKRIVPVEKKQIHAAVRS